jgi:ParB-like chromosome segregation protein Spo0J
MSELQFHPLPDAFPPLEGDEFDALVADIKANGLREPITIFEGKILDGRNRYRACVKVGIEVKTEPFEGTEADARAFVISKNIHRHSRAETRVDRQADRGAAREVRPPDRQGRDRTIRERQARWAARKKEKTDDTA